MVNHQEERKRLAKEILAEVNKEGEVDRADILARHQLATGYTEITLNRIVELLVAVKAIDDNGIMLIAKKHDESGTKAETGQG